MSVAKYSTNSLPETVLGRTMSTLVPWKLELDWAAPSQLSPDLQVLACRLAAQGTLTEEAGLLASAKLCRSISDRTARRFLANQTAEEAMHSALFERYVKCRNAQLQAPTHATNALLEGLEELEDIDELFLVHTLLEGMALDEFSLLAEAFAEDLLGQIYRSVRVDEARHVSFGIGFLQQQCRENSTRNRLSSWSSERVFALAGIRSGGFAKLAEIVGDASLDVEALLSRRIDRRLQQIVLKPHDGSYTHDHQEAVD